MKKIRIFDIHHTPRHATHHATQEFYDDESIRLVYEQDNEKGSAYKTLPV